MLGAVVDTGWLSGHKYFDNRGKEIWIFDGVDTINSEVGKAYDALSMEVYKDGVLPGKIKDSWS